MKRTLQTMKNRNHDMTLTRVCLLLSILAWSHSAPAQEREIKVRGDKKRVESDGYWIYNDLPRGIARNEEAAAGRLSVHSLRKV